MKTNKSEVDDREHYWLWRDIVVSKQLMGWWWRRWRRWRRWRQESKGSGILYYIPQQPQRSVPRITKFPMPLKLQISLGTSTLSTKKQDINIHNYPPNTWPIPFTPAAGKCHSNTLLRRSFFNNVFLLHNHIVNLGPGLGSDLHPTLSDREVISMCGME